MTEEERQERIAALRQKLAAREGKPGYAVNAEQLKAEIERLEAENAS